METRQRTDDHDLRLRRSATGFRFIESDTTATRKSVGVFIAPSEKNAQTCCAPCYVVCLSALRSGSTRRIDGDTLDRLGSLACRLLLPCRHPGGMEALMPDESEPVKKPVAQSSLSEEQQKQILNWIKERWTGSQECSICGHREWVVAPDLVTPMSWRKGSIGVGGTSYPYVQVICANCARMHLFNATVVLEMSGHEKGGDGDG